MKSYSVIVTDLQYRKAFDIYNICKKINHQIVATASGTSLQKIILSLIYLNNVKKLNHESFDVDFKSLIGHSSKKFVFFPTEEATIILFFDYISKYKTDNIFYNLPSKEAFETVRNKGDFSSFCTEHKLPIPFEFKYNQLVSLDQIPCDLIIKPKIGSGSAGIYFIDSMQELLDLKKLDFNDHIIQERLSNSKDVEGAFFLFDQGKIVSYYGHRRIRTYPEKGGVTIYSEYENNNTLKSLGSELLQKLEWSGLAMVEFIFDEKSQTYKIIEVNPRAWGSIMLSEFSGSNMIENYIRTSLGKVPKTSKTKDTAYIRWLFPWDVILFIKSKGSIDGFWDFNLRNTCYINFTYGSWYRNIAFLFFSIFTPNKIHKLFKRILAK